MELVTDVINNQLYLYFPVALVLIGAVLVFTFGFKSAEQPHFIKLSSNVSEDKRTASKKRKPKDKKAVNGSAVPVSEVKATKEKQSPSKETPTTPKQTKSKEPEKKKEVQKLIKPLVSENLNKKNAKAKHEKPVDYDDGSWETVPSKTDKKVKKPESPAKKNKPKKIENENVKDDLNQVSEESKEYIKKIVDDEVKKQEIKESIPVVEEKNVKKEKKVLPEKENVIQEPVPKQEIPELISEEVVTVDTKKENEEESSVEVKPTPAAAAAVFDELGDIWTDPKAVKKSKKKSRRDN